METKFVLFVDMFDEQKEAASGNDWSSMKDNNVSVSLIAFYYMPLMGLRKCLHLLVLGG